ncbi:MAG: ATP synthase F0 subunit B [Planctomycetaceae bacterium]
MLTPLFFWSLGLFLLFLFVSRKVAWAPLIAGLDAREARVNRALHDAEAARVEAEKLLADHAARMDRVQEEVKGIVAAARKEAEAEKARIIAEADAAAAGMRDRAIAEIRQAHRLALDDLQSQIDRQADLATEHVLGVGR